MLKQLATLVLFAVTAVAIPLAAAVPAAADGPANAQEAAICKQLLAWATPVGITPTSVNAVCTVKSNHH